MTETNADKPAPEPVIRRLWPADFGRFREHLKRLDPASRYSRFGGAVGEEFIDAYVDGAHRLGTFIYGGFLGDTLRAVAELRILSDHWPPEAEAAFSVEAPYQNGGIGDALLRRIIIGAQNRGVSSVYMICLRENDRMRHLAKKHHARLQFDPGSISGKLDPAWPTPASLLEETMGEARGFVTAVLHWPGGRPAG